MRGGRTQLHGRELLGPASPAVRHQHPAVNTESQVVEGDARHHRRLQEPVHPARRGQGPRGRRRRHLYDADEAQMYRDEGATVRGRPGRCRRPRDSRSPTPGHGWCSWAPVTGRRIRRPDRAAAVPDRRGIEGAELRWSPARKAANAPEVTYLDVNLDSTADDQRLHLPGRPVATGGGVRVKILDAASRGLPGHGRGHRVTRSGVFDLTLFDDEAVSSSRARRYSRVRCGPRRRSRAHCTTATRNDGPTGSPAGRRTSSAPDRSAVDHPGLSAGASPSSPGGVQADRSVLNCTRTPPPGRGISSVVASRRGSHAETIPLPMTWVPVDGEL